MKKHFLVLGAGFLFSLSSLMSCDAQKSTSTTPDQHSSQSSLDYDGIYRGTLPCADCSGIKTTVYLMRDGSYKMLQEYMDKGDKPFESTGKFSWDKTGSIITINDNGQKTIFKVGENTLTQLDQDGKAITGQLARNYILTKGNYSLLNKKWRLVEIMGKPVKLQSTDTKEPFIIFDDATNRYSSSALCNTVNGSFSVEGFNHLTLKEGMTTMMACADMTLENQLKEVLRTADSFQINGDELVLIKGRMAPLARFKVPMH